MNKWCVRLSIVLISTVAVSVMAQNGSDTTWIDRIAARERQEVSIIRQFHPVIETYIQDVKPDREFGTIPVNDHYYLAIADFTKNMLRHDLLQPPRERTPVKNAMKDMYQFWSELYAPAGFLEMIFVDRGYLDKEHYHFEYIRREFLGEVKCTVVDVTPLPSFGRGFHGRIWVDEQDNAIVRFNGIYTPITTFGGFNVHFDSWRVNARPGVWLPAYVYSQESYYKEPLSKPVRFRSQTRLWGYDTKHISDESEFSELTVEAAGAQDQSAADQTAAPVEAERQWQHAAEDNIVDRLQRAGFVAPPGPVDKLLATVVNNLEVTNNLDIQPEIRCRVLLTSPFESFSVGHTVVISRGLLDVLPDEASLAAVLAQEVATISLTNPDMNMWGFNDLSNIAAVEVFQRFRFRTRRDDTGRATEKALELLKNSPYKDQLQTAGLFLKQLSAEQKALPSLINARLGNRIVLSDKLEAIAPPLEPKRLDQTAALPLGGRISLNPWDDHVQLSKTAPVALISDREKMPFELTPFEPYLTYYKASDETPAPSKTKKSDDKLPRNAILPGQPR